MLIQRIEINMVYWEMNVRTERDYLNELYNKASYLSEGEWNNGDYASCKAEIEELERRLQEEDERGSW